jgi:hypothetical protein
MAFQQATIEPQKQETVAALKVRIDSVLEPANIDAFMKGVIRAGFPIRQWDKLLSAGLLDKKDSSLTAKQLYAELGDTDRGLVREFYLTRIEQVPDAIREKYSKVYRYA